MSDLLSKLNKALKSKGGTNASGPASSLIHENEKAILEAATQLLSKSERGREVLQFAQSHNVKMHVLRNQDDYGFFPDKSEVYISCPAGQDRPSTRVVIHLAGLLREAMLEATEGLKRPNPAIDQDSYVRIQMEREKDISIWQTLIVHEIYEVTGLLEIIDEFKRMGYSSLIEAHQLDLAEKSPK